MEDISRSRRTFQPWPQLVTGQHHWHSAMDRLHRGFGSCDQNRIAGEAVPLCSSMYSAGSLGSVKKNFCFAASHSKKPVDGTAHRRTATFSRNTVFMAAVSALALITSGPADQQPKDMSSGTVPLLPASSTGALAVRRTSPGCQVPVPYFRSIIPVIR